MVHLSVSPHSHLAGSAASGMLALRRTTAPRVRGLCIAGDTVGNLMWRLANGGMPTARGYVVQIGGAHIPIG